ncbi:hypothetical protein SAMN05444921_11884 [Streptomyces wuyuanensis]|uniref:Uncharacterized protein n=1 Tax=Streptomyces wuyuanensis TaxID=1196353 RepID=A0A1G9YD07_9ACTN|nr:hypothetical protein SAMN05444921_11884 [Streptomyces wuyuanensis]
MIVHLGDCRVLHLSDEGNGAWGAMADADQLKIQTVLGAVAVLFEEKQATILTDGHSFALRRGASAGHRPVTSRALLSTESIASTPALRRRSRAARSAGTSRAATCTA